MWIARRTEIVNLPLLPDKNIIANKKTNLPIDFEKEVVTSSFYFKKVRNKQYNYNSPGFGNVRKTE